jgi:hypothetical protein
LTGEELRRWQEALHRWDAFLTFVIKQIGEESSLGDLRSALADVLVASRFDMLEALVPSHPGAPDPTPELFLKTWERLAPVVRQSSLRVPGATALRYLSFVAAGDALAALERMGPDVGIDISADGLRRLARVVAPLVTTDPLEYSLGVDPELRRLFGFGPPLPTPDLSDEPPEGGTPGDDGADRGGAWWQRLLAPDSALAREEKRAPAAARTPAAAVERWLPSPGAYDAYLKAIRGVLDEAAKQVLAGGNLPVEFRELYGRLVLATAWQESCWRQFVRSGSKVTFVRSPIGSIGMMQVNEHVWRGLYDVRGLRWDIHYNGLAGSEILLHYLTDYAIAQGEHKKTGNVENLARATYAVYNAGPAAVARYRAKSAVERERAVDGGFWQKYQAIRDGKEDIASCLG